MNNNFSIEIGKKVVEKTIIKELCKKNVIDFCQCNNIIKKIDEDIIKLREKLNIKADMINIVVKIPI